jgi:Tol biopolymer transport system component
MRMAFVALFLGAALAAPAHAAYPGPNGSIAYVSSPVGPPIPSVVDPDRHVKPRAIGQGGEVAPTWSPDGAAVAVSSGNFIPGGPSTFAIVVMRADGSERSQLTADHALDYDPSWSPDGTKIAYSSDAGGARAIWVVASKGGAPKRLTTGPVDDTPAWSPDGTRIAFTRTTGIDGRIWIMGADGSHPQAVLEEPGDDEDPEWSPDGAHIAYTHYDDNSSTADVWIMGADGSDPDALAVSKYNETQPSWSPDGTRVAFTSNRHGHDSIWVIPATGGHPRNITPDGASDDSPAWGARSTVGNMRAVPGLRPAPRLHRPSL